LVVSKLAEKGDWGSEASFVNLPFFGGSPGKGFGDFFFSEIREFSGV
jgi:hypothetical protein